MHGLLTFSSIMLFFNLHKSYKDYWILGSYHVCPFTTTLTLYMLLSFLIDVLDVHFLSQITLLPLLSLCHNSSSSCD
jgi:hypothetical protein